MLYIFLESNFYLRIAKFYKHELVIFMAIDCLVNLSFMIMLKVNVQVIVGYIFEEIIYAY